MNIENSRDYMDQVFNEYARIGKALSSDKRLEILHRMIHGPKTVEQLSDMTDMSVANTSRHLQVLKEASLVVLQKEGKYSRYSVSSHKVEQLLALIHQISDEQTSMLQFIEQKYINTDDYIKTIDLSEAKAKVFEQQAQLVDLRSKVEFDIDHVEGAVNIPFKSLSDNFDKLEKDRPVILYCRGLFCVYANEAAALLNKNGFQAYSVSGTHFDWNRQDD